MLGASHLLRGIDSLRDVLAGARERLRYAVAVQDVVAVKHRAGFPSADFQNCSFVYSRIEQIDCAGASAIVDAPARVVVPHPRLLVIAAQPGSRASSIPFRSIVRRVEYRLLVFMESFP